MQGWETTGSCLCRERRGFVGTGNNDHFKYVNCKYICFKSSATRVAGNQKQNKTKQKPSLEVLSIPEKFFSV